MNKRDYPARIDEIPYFRDSRPLTRWWWFAENITTDEIDSQLDWIEAQGFGGVEVAWVYAGKRGGTIPSFLGPEWQRLVAHAKRSCDARGLACDFTFGTLWPFGGSMVDAEHASKTYDGISAQRLNRSWENAEGKPPSYLIDHLDREALQAYADVLERGLLPALEGGRSALFCDSWEVDPAGLWTEGFGAAFQRRYGYDLVPYMSDIDHYPSRRYDYRRLRGEYALREFYEAYTDVTNEMGALSRVQAHGAPADLLAAYAAADIPESEALLFDPPFSTFAASAAALAGRPLVTTEAFTCIYGWEPYPERGPHLKEEQPADLKYLADSLFANGVNHVIWHGMPFNPPGGPNEFYATVHVGPDAAFADELPAFNNYMSRVSAALKRGKTHAQLAVYAPYEDTLMAGELPEELRRPSAMYHWEMHYTRLPESLRGYRPVWISEPFLDVAEVEDGEIVVGDLRLEGLLVDVAWMERSALSEVVRLARAGAHVFMPRRPAAPGTLQPADYGELLETLRGTATVFDALPDSGQIMPLVEGPAIPEFWCRRDGETYIFFFAHPASAEIRYPMTYGQSLTTEVLDRPLRLSVAGYQRDITLHFRPYESILLSMTKGQLDFMELSYRPSEPLAAGV